MSPRVGHAAAAAVSVIDLINKKTPADNKKTYKVPKAVLAARLKCGAEVCAEDLKHKLSKQESNNLANNYRAGMTPEVKDEYARLKSDSERRQWLAQYVMDPETATRKGFNSTVATNETMKEGTGQWLHLSELGGPLHLNNMKLAQDLVDSGTLQEQPSEHEALAEPGRKQYDFSKELVRPRVGTTEQAGVKLETELKADEYKEVRQLMSTSLGKSF